MLFTTKKIDQYIPQAISQSERTLAALREEVETAHRAFLTRSDKILLLERRLESRDLDAEEYKNAYGALQYEQRQLGIEESALRDRQEALDLLVNKEKLADELRQRARAVADFQAKYDDAFSAFKSEEKEFLKLRDSLPAKGKQVQLLMIQLNQAKAAMQSLQSLPQEEDL